MSEASTRLKTGDKVFVTTAGEPAVKGTLIDISSSSMRVMVDGHRRDFSTSDLTRIERERRSTKRGALIGLLAGGLGVPTVVYTIMERNCARTRGTIHACDDQWDPLMVGALFGGVGGAIGTGAGAVAGYAFTRRETVFAAPGGNLVTVKPIVARSRMGLAVSIGF